MLPTHDIPAVRCEAAAPGVEVGAGGVAWAADGYEVYGRARIIRVEIRPAPKRKSKRTQQ